MKPCPNGQSALRMTHMRTKFPVGSEGCARDRRVVETRRSCFCSPDHGDNSLIINRKSNTKCHKNIR